MCESNASNPSWLNLFVWAYNTLFFQGKCDSGFICTIWKGGAHQIPSNSWGQNDVKKRKRRVSFIWMESCRNTLTFYICWWNRIYSFSFSLSLFFLSFFLSIYLSFFRKKHLNLIFRIEWKIVFGSKKLHGLFFFLFVWKKDLTFFQIEILFRLLNRWISLISSSSKSIWDIWTVTFNLLY